MNAAALKTRLNDAGYGQAARRLEEYLLENGLPCDRAQGGQRIRIRLCDPLEAKPGSLVAVTLRQDAAGAWVEGDLVCTERAVRRFREPGAMGRRPLAAGDPTRRATYQITTSLYNRLEAWCADHEDAPHAAALRRAVELFLNAEGY